MAGRRGNAVHVRRTGRDASGLLLEKLEELAQRLKPAPSRRGEVIGLLTLLGLGAGYAIHQHERLSTMEEKLADRPVLMERRDRENDTMRADITELRQMLFGCTRKP